MYNIKQSFAYFSALVQHFVDFLFIRLPCGHSLMRLAREHSTLRHQHTVISLFAHMSKSLEIYISLGKFSKLDLNFLYLIAAAPNQCCYSLSSVNSLYLDCMRY